MPKRKRPEEKPKEQFKRFERTAKELGVDENAQSVDRVFKRLARPSSSSGSKERSK